MNESQRIDELQRGNIKIGGKQEGTKRKNSSE
jgi:hypothetical protein